MCPASVCRIMIPRMLWRNVMCRKWCWKLFQVMQPGINQSACGEETRPDAWLGFTGRRQCSVEGFGWFLFGKSALENGLMTRNRCNGASEKREYHTCANAKTWKRMHSCVIILFISRIGRKFQLLPWKAGKSSAEKSTITQCSSGLWSKLYRCRFQPERPRKKRIL